MVALVRRFLSCRAGSTAIEYALIASLISISIVAGVSAVGTEVNNSYGQIENALKR